MHTQEAGFVLGISCEPRLTSVALEAESRRVGLRQMIEVQKLCKRFPLAGGRMLDAVQDVSFRVVAGEVYGLLGPNGAGKTTTFRMLIGLLQPTSGQASIAGFGSRSQPDEVKRRVGIVSATAGLYPWLCVRG